MSHNMLITSCYKIKIHKCLQQNEGIQRINFKFSQKYTCIYI